MYEHDSERKKDLRLEKWRRSTSTRKLRLDLSKSKSENYLQCVKLSYGQQIRLEIHRGSSSAYVYFALYDIPTSEILSQ